MIPGTGISESKSPFLVSKILIPIVVAVAKRYLLSFVTSIDLHESYI